ncbi:uncharacterized protein LOC118438002 [Folsomia candida]|uniref:uncharacterized protein LOC118438002 n=1 Tax=Folsomia candida TaxID=158441 RepID=UPI001604A7E6|nr:uncharacterized protein LOC118438002 [Folsomia candida]
MNTSSAMESVFTFDQANYVGRLESSFLAEVWWTQENFFEQFGRPIPYLRVTMTQDDGVSHMDAIAFGNSYHVVKNFYKLGKVYCFPRGMFEIRPRTSNDTLSTYPYDLWFLNDSATSDETRPKSSWTSQLEESMQDMSIL